jgi:hypothetical protein
MVDLVRLYLLKDRQSPEFVYETSKQVQMVRPKRGTLCDYIMFLVLIATRALLKVYFRQPL